MRTLAEYAAAAPLFRYDRDSGELINIVKGCASGYQRKDGYRYVRANKVKFFEHRLIWFIVLGELPEQIDHVNMCRYDNRWSNLRAATPAENNRNRKAQSNNALGIKGVWQHKKTGRYKAIIYVDKRRIMLGTFNTPEEASEAYQRAAKEHHGTFARS